jgi:uncharacterized protein YggE
MWKFAVAAVTLLVVGLGSAAAQDSRIVVTGEGTASARPDRARVTVGVRTARPSAADALAANNRRTRAVIEAVRQVGVPSAAIETRALSMRRQTGEGDTAASGRRYVVTNAVRVDSDVDQVGAVIDEAVAAGANRVSGIAFATADEDALANEARRRAVRAARAKAELLAQEAGVSLGPVRAIVEGGGPGPRPVMRAARAAPTPVEAGQAEVRATVTVTFALEP